MSFISVIEDLEKQTTPLGVLRYPTRTDGDVQITWDKSNSDDVRKARKIFNDLKDKGYRAFSGKKMDQTLSVFDPEVDRIAMLPPIVGG